MIDRIGFLPQKPTVVPDAFLNRSKDLGAAQIADQFGVFLNNAMENLNKQHHALDTLNDQFVRGEIADVHQLTIAAEKLSLGVELTVQIRNKAIEAYQEIMRTQL